jgi:hypothetical protein
MPQGVGEHAPLPSPVTVAVVARAAPGSSLASSPRSRISTRSNAAKAPMTDRSSAPSAHPLLFFATDGRVAGLARS